MIRSLQDEVTRLRDLQEANYKAMQDLKAQIASIEREKDNAMGEVKVAGRAAERSLREKEKEVLRWEKKFMGLEGELISVRKKLEESQSKSLAQENEKIKVELEMMQGAVSRLELAKKGLESEVTTLTEDVRSSDKSLRESTAEQRRLQEVVAEVQDTAVRDRRELEKWKKASETVQSKLSMVYQLVVDAAESGGDIDKVLFDVKFVMLGDEA